MARSHLHTHGPVAASLQHRHGSPRQGHMVGLRLERDVHPRTKKPSVDGRIRKVPTIIIAARLFSRGAEAVSRSGGSDMSKVKARDSRRAILSIPWVAPGLSILAVAASGCSSHAERSFVSNSGPGYEGCASCSDDGGGSPGFFLGD